MFAKKEYSIRGAFFALLTVLLLFSSSTAYAKSKAYVHTNETTYVYDNTNKKWMKAERKNIRYLKNGRIKDVTVSYYNYSGEEDSLKTDEVWAENIFKYTYKKGVLSRIKAYSYYPLGKETEYIGKIDFVYKKGRIVRHETYSVEEKKTRKTKYSYKNGRLVKIGVYRLQYKNGKLNKVKTANSTYTFNTKGFCKKESSKQGRYSYTIKYSYKYQKGKYIKEVKSNNGSKTVYSGYKKVPLVKHPWDSIRFIPDFVDIFYDQMG